MAQNSRLKQLKSQQKVNRIPERYLAGMVSVFPGNPDENGNVIFFVQRMLTRAFPTM